ncbi:MAG: MFS transporter [Solirubrobacterales bacterium]|nr:MFS transporter [Solirubrobacterales bacterium]
MLFAITIINYADRASVAIAGPVMSKALGLSPVQMGFVFSAFGYSCVVGQLPGGWALDRFGSKSVYFGSIFFWSLFTVAVGIFGAVAVYVLFFLRFTIGFAEAPSFPADSRIVAAWFPANERGTASAIFNSAQYFATVLFAPIMGFLRRRWSLTSARKTPIVAGTLMAMVVCNYVDAAWVVVLIMAVALFRKGLGALGWAVVSDTVPREIAGLSGGLFSMFGNVSSITTPIVIGHIIQSTGSFNGALVFIAANAAVAVLSCLVIVGEIRRFQLRRNSGSVIT